MNKHNRSANDNHPRNEHIHDSSKLSGKKIFWVTVLNASITFLEIIGGILSGSLALVSDSVHNLSDTVSIALSYIANKIAQKPKNEKKHMDIKGRKFLWLFLIPLFCLQYQHFLFMKLIKDLNPQKLSVARL